MEKQKVEVPQDILDIANSTFRNYMIPFDKEISLQREGYIQGRMDERASQATPSAQNIEEAAREYIGEQRKDESLDAYCSKIELFVTAISWYQKQHPVGKWADEDMLTAFCVAFNKANNCDWYVGVSDKATQWLSDYKKQKGIL